MRISIALLIGLLSLMTCLAGGASAWNKTDVDILKGDLLKDYDRFTRPAQQKDKTFLELGTTIINIDLDETRGVLISHVWLKMNWSDSKLTWDKTAYGGIKEIRVSADEIWQPDVSVYNSAEHGIVDHFAKTNKIVYNNGYVLWVPTAKFETYCHMDLKLWPFDIQKCSIKIGSWTYSGLQIDFQASTPAIDLAYYNSYSEWQILKTSFDRNVKYYPCCVEPYIDISTNRLITFYANDHHLAGFRYSPTFKTIVVAPAIVIVFMTLVSFWLPPQAAGEKLLLNGVACVVICMLLTYFTKLLPILASSTPLIVTFYSHTLYLLCISFIISVIVINMSRNRKQYAVPHSIKAYILDGFIGKALGGAQPDPLVAENHAEELRETPFEEHRHSENHQIIQAPSSTKPNLIQNEWIQLAVIIDRITFFIYVFVFIAMGFLHFI